MPYVINANDTHIYTNHKEFSAYIQSFCSGAGTETIWTCQYAGLLFRELFPAPCALLLYDYELVRLVVVVLVATPMPWIGNVQGHLFHILLVARIFLHRYLFRHGSRPLKQGHKQDGASERPILCPSGSRRDAKSGKANEVF